jgi:hypothetical protein
MRKSLGVLSKTVVVAALICVFVALAVHVFRPTSVGSLAVIIAVGMAGAVPLGIAISIAATMYEAKREFGLILKRLSPPQLHLLRIMVRSSNFPGLSPYFHQDGRIDRQLSELAKFLDVDPLGRTVSRALLQASHKARIRYIDSALILVGASRAAPSVA